MKTRQQALQYGLSFPDTYQDAPFHDDNWQLVRYRGNKKAFLWTYEKDGYVNLNVKVDPGKAFFWRDRYPSVLPGYHQNKDHWNTIVLDGSIPDRDVKQMIRESYELISDCPSRRIYEAVKKIPYGRVATYADIAELAVSAHGNALPCFQLIAAVLRHCAAERDLSCTEQRKAVPAGNAVQLCDDAVKALGCRLNGHALEMRRCGFRQLLRDPAMHRRMPDARQLAADVIPDRRRAEQPALLAVRQDIAGLCPLNAQMHHRTQNIAVRERLGKFLLRRFDRDADDRKILGIPELLLAPEAQHHAVGVFMPAPDGTAAVRQLPLHRAVFRILRFIQKIRERIASVPIRLIRKIQQTLPKKIVLHVL